jgi:hypothetical protein
MLIGPGPQYNIPYVLVGPDGTRAVFNDQTDPDYVGALTAISGFDSPEVRESADELVQFDGGVHGDFWYGRRPITMEGIIYDHGSSGVRNARVARLAAASNAMREDATLTFTPSGAPEMFIKVRRQQPLRVDGAWNKTFQIPLVAADPRFYSTTLNTTIIGAETLTGSTGFSFPMSFPLSFGDPHPQGQLLIENLGNGETFPVYSIFGPGVGPFIYNATTGKFITLNYPLVNASDGFVIDSLNRQVYLGSRDTSLDVVNLMVNPSLESNSLNWSLYESGGGGFGGVFTRQPDTSGYGNYIARITKSSGTPRNTGVFLSVGTTLAAGEYNFSAWVKGPAGATGVIYVQWANPSDSDSTPFTFTGSWQRVSTPFTPPAGYTNLIPHIWLDNMAVGQTLDIDGVMVSAGSELQTYVDGDRDGCGWDGVPNASTSRAFSTVLNPSSRIDKYSAIDFVNTDWGGLVGGENDLRINFYSFSHGARMRVDWRSAWL